MFINNLLNKVIHAKGHALNCTHKAGLLLVSHFLLGGWTIMYSELTGV